MLQLKPVCGKIELLKLRVRGSGISWSFGDPSLEAVELHGSSRASETSGSGLEDISELMGSSLP